MGKVALVAPAATVTVWGTAATVVLLLARLTIAPPPGAAAVRTTLPVAVLLPTGLPGMQEIDFTAGEGVSRKAWLPFGPFPTPTICPPSLMSYALTSVQPELAGRRVFKSMIPPLR